MENLTLALDDHIATLTIDRPQALNALNRATLDELHSIVTDLRLHADLRAVVLTGAGTKAFVAGADIKEMAEMSAGEAWQFSRRGQATLSLLSTARFVTIAAVNGFALGGGCELALACDLIYASETAMFGQPEVNLAVIPGFGATQRLPRVVGTMMARELILSGRMIQAEEALRIGMIARIFPADELLEQSRKVARVIAEKGPLAIQAAKRVLDEGPDLPFSQGSRMESEEFGELFSSRDQREGMTAFLEKRAPLFKAH